MRGRTNERHHPENGTGKYNRSAHISPLVTRLNVPVEQVTLIASFHEMVIT